MAKITAKEAIEAFKKQGGEFERIVKRFLLEVPDSDSYMRAVCNTCVQEMDTCMASLPDAGDLVEDAESLVTKIAALRAKFSTLKPEAKPQAKKCLC